MIGAEGEVPTIEQGYYSVSKSLNAFSQILKLPV